ncbi:MAG: hypothetical protein APR53_08470 [Methanoculleus sp. SDB]|nr:MAG: hypothetical protein APR53_08470 [Methanoculleus sp. SDB]
MLYCALFYSGVRRVFPAISTIQGCIERYPGLPARAAFGGDTAVHAAGGRKESGNVRSGASLTGKRAGMITGARIHPEPDSGEA